MHTINAKSTLRQRRDCALANAIRACRAVKAMRQRTRMSRKHCELLKAMYGVEETESRDMVESKWYEDGGAE